MAPETYQVKLPLISSDVSPLTEGEAEEELEEASPMSLNEIDSNASEEESELSQGYNQDDDDGGCFDSADIITTAAASWCVHKDSEDSGEC
ncbi:hypothetical protein Emed_006486 [Eimeria media]